MPTVDEPSHRQRGMAESFGGDAARYDRTRPRYPQALIDRLALRGKDVLDVGCGTGIVSRQLLDDGARVLGLEPDERMARVARGHGIEVEVGRIEEFTTDGRFDAVVAGQTWHWVEPEAGARVAASVLRPGGLLALFWNAGSPPPELAEGFADAARRALPDLALPSMPANARPYGPVLDRAAEGARAAGFDEPEEWSTEWAHRYSREEWLDQVPTQGFFTRLEPEDLERLLTETGAVIDAAGGAFEMRFTTVALLARCGRSSPGETGPPPEETCGCLP